MIAGIYYGAQYGGSTTAILVNIPGEGFLGGDHDRRPPDKAARSRRAGVRVAAIGSASRTVRLAADLDRCAAACRDTRRIRSRRIFLADGVRPDRGGGAGAWLHHQGDRHGDPRVAAGARRHRRQFRHPPLRFRLPGLADGIEFVALSVAIMGWPKSPTISSARSTASSPAMSAGCGRAGPTSRPASLRSCAERSWARSWACCLAAERCWRPSRPIRSKVAKPPRSFGQGDIRGVAAPGVGQQRGRPDFVHSDAHAGHPSNPPWR